MEKRVMKRNRIMNNPDLIRREEAELFHGFRPRIRKKPRFRKQLTALSAAILLSSPAAASGIDDYDGGYTCPNADIFTDLLDRVPFGAMLPISVGGARLGNSSHGDRTPGSASRRSVCTCSHDLGIPETGLTVGLWEVAYLMEFTREPGCSPVLGTMLPLPDRGIGSFGDGTLDSSDLSLYHVHLYSFPLNTMLNLFTDFNCGRYDYMDMDLLYASELDVSWYDESLAMINTPEIATLANAGTVASCSADATLSFKGNTSDDLFYCAGSWGFLYPLTGYVGTSGSVAENTSLLAVRVMNLLHRRGLLPVTMGDDALCGGVYYDEMSKSMYRFSMLYPFAESSDNHALGEPVQYWLGDSRVPPTKHNVIYLVWRYRNCCLGAGK